MKYYRYRPSSELTIKELMYDEIYFASTKECNDPFDGKTFLIFETDKDKWQRLFEHAWRNFNINNSSKWAEQLSVLLTQRSPLNYTVAQRINYIEALLSLNSPPDTSTALLLGSRITQFINLYKPKDKYFVSFSKIDNNILMWSHYASMHHGHCLIFKAIDGFLYQSPDRARKSISRNTQFGLAPSMSYAFPEGFQFQDVIYKYDVTKDDAFSYFPDYVFGRKLTEQERIDFINLKNQLCLEKHECWSYEQESRLILPSPDSWLFGEHIDYNQQERLLHYKPNQLIGIIFGALMDEQQKERLRIIIQERMDHIARIANSDNLAVFNFVVFQAKLSENSRNVNIEAEDLYALHGKFNKNNKDFNKYYDEWKEGWAIQFNGTSASHKRFE